MPLKLSVGVSRKLGLPGYSSLGASCLAEFDMDASLLRINPEEFHRKVRRAYDTCAGVVDDQLARWQTTSAPSPHARRNEPEAAGAPTSPANGEAVPPPHDQHAAPSNGNGRDGMRSQGSPASQKQMDYVRQLAGRIPGLGIRRVETLVQRMFGKPQVDLTQAESTVLTETLRNVKAGRADFASLLCDAPA